MGNVIKGSINVPGEINMDCTFEDDLKAKQLTVGKSGCVCGNTHAHTVIVHGRIDQKLVSTALINIYATGRITGDVIYYAIEIKKGGKLEGTLTRRNQSDEESQTNPSNSSLEALALNGSFSLNRMTLR